MRRRTLLFVALALCVPLPAFALSGDQPSPANLSVSVALDRCGLAGSQILCKFDLSFDSVEDATSYTAAVTRPDGSVIDAGEVGASPASVWVPYAGNGTYSVEVSAYGDPDEPGDEPKLLDRQRGELDDDEAAEKAGGDGGDAARADGDANDERAEPDGEPAEPACPASEGEGEGEEAGADSQATGADEAATMEGAGDEAPEEGVDAEADEAVEPDQGELDTISSCPH